MRGARGRVGILLIAAILVVVTLGLAQAYLVISASQARASTDRGRRSIALALAEEGVESWGVVDQ